MPTLALLDGHSLAYRAFYALPDDLSTKAGQITNAAYGFTSMLIKLLDDHSPEGLAVAWDVGRSTFRTEAYPEYKAQRESAPDHFRTQLPLMQDLLETMQVPQLTAEGFEADDVIATVARMAARAGWDVLVVTGDRDSFQLVDDNIKVVYTRRGISDTVLADTKWITEKYGVTPEQYSEYAALRGDNSDNLPGVPGVGEKTAAKLIGAYGTLEGVFDHLAEQTPKLRENLAANRDQVFLNRELMALVDDVEIGVDVDALERVVPDREATKAAFDRLEFTSLWTRLTDLDGGVSAREVDEIDVEVHSVQAADRLDSLDLSDGIVLEPVHDAGELVGLMLLPLSEEPGDGEPGTIEPGRIEDVYFIPDRLFDEISSLLDDASVAKSIDHAKSFMRSLLEHDLPLGGIEFDPALANYVIDPASPSHELDAIASRYLGVELEPLEDSQADQGAQGMLDFGSGPDLETAGRRAVAVRRLRPLMEADLKERGGVELFHEMELPLVEVLARMEMAGVAVDRDYLSGLGDSLRDQLEALEADIHEAAGEPFNVNSTLQLRKVLFEDLELPVLKKTSKGAPSTDASVLAKLEDAHPIVALLLRYRELDKLRGTYVEGYLPLIQEDGRIRAHFNQIAAATGRLSSDRPNMQNIPVRSETGMTIRRAFVPREGWTFVVADYSQIELRILAHLSKDPGLLEAFAADQDIHTATAARVFGFTPDLVTTEMRRRAKVINFGLLYGMEAFGLADRLEISRDEAQEHMDAYFTQFPDVREFMQSVVTDAKKTGYTTTIFGRRRYLAELSSDNFRVRQMGERMALNAPVQGSAADIIKLAMIELDKRLADVEADMLLQIHDELVLEAAPDVLEEVTATVVEVMEGVADMDVPLTVDVAHGSDLAAVKG